MVEATPKSPVSALLRKLGEIAARYDELQQSLNDPAVLSNSQQVVAISKESGRLEGVVARYRDYLKAMTAVEELGELSGQGGDAEMAEMARLELPEAQAKAAGMLEGLKDEFVAAEDNAIDSFFLEIRAGTGGEEAALFARDLFEMYRLYAEQHGWTFIVNDFSTSDRGGI